MTYSIYTTEELDGFKRNKLWTICKRMKLKCRPSAQDCRNAIAATQQQRVVVDEQTSAQSELEAHVEQQCQAIAPETCATCPHYQAFDGEQRGYCPLRDGVVRPHFPKSGECRHLEEIEREFVAATPAPKSQSITYDTDPIAQTCTCKAGQYRKPCRHPKEATADWNASMMEFRHGDVVQIQSGALKEQQVAVEYPIPDKGVLVYIPRSGNVGGHRLLLQPSNLRKVQVTTQFSDVEWRAIALMKSWNLSQEALDTARRRAAV